MSCTFSGFLNFHVSHLNHETFKLCLQNTLNISKTTRVYFRVLQAFEQMKLSLGVLNSAGQILSSFNGVTTVTLGDVALPVKAGPVTQQVLFSIVEDLGPYNAIMGRVWLHSMTAIPLTYHQTVGYFTNVAQVDLLSRQLAAR